MNARRPIAWSITDHAALRYCQRIDQRLQPAGAMTLLRALLPQASLLPEPTFHGQQRWLLPDGNAVVVAKPDPKLGAHVAVTVLGPGEMYDVEAVGDVVEAFQRATATPSAPVPMPPAKVRVVEFRPAEKPKKETVSRAHFEQTERELASLREKFNGLQDVYNRLLAAHTDLKNRRDPAVPMGDDDRRRLQSMEDQLAHWKARALRVEDQLLRVATSPVAMTAATLKSITAGDLVRARAALEHQERESKLSRQLLRVAVIALRSAASESEAARAGLSALESARPGITGDHFCYPERFTKAERKAATVAAEQAAGGTREVA